MEAGQPSPSATDRLEDDVEVIARLPVASEVSQLHVVLALGRPKVLLWKATLEQLDYRLMALCLTHHVGAFVLANPGYGLLGSARLYRLGGLPWLRLRWRHRHAATLIKRALDVLLVLACSPLALPVLLAVCAAVGRDGPPLYFQDRVGAGGRVFRLVKIRTMGVGVERATGPVLASADDPRVTPLGRVLRRLRIDELPQLWNVLRGEMSLVGPRPERPEFVMEFRLLPHYDLRHLVRPGMTGIAQLTGGYAASVAEKLRCDLLYVGTWSLRLDLKLLALTVADLLRGFPRG
ncbi:hypothetical protein GTS_51870 [Gandjariella thermophila]|uniref:Bacterial sugar transferase domain-containing protein n=1 Tax=Gandjariella thermophila TaxID=1931992 RepID=A0A4D4JD47_9PSEU|nr:hypothetical protein GTS_51870 [Gandjariella thermophila]